MNRTLLVLLSAAGAFLAAALFPNLWAGHPACEKPVCAMKSCQSFDKRGKPNGVKCSNDCSRGCCRCPQHCNRHEEDRSPGDES